MAGLGDSYENIMLDRLLGNSTPANVTIALFTAAPTDAGGGTEVTGGSYARVTVANNATNWPAASGGSKSNGTAIVFPVATATWGTISHFAVFDGSTLMVYGAVGTPKLISAGETAQFNPGTLIVTCD